MAFPTLTETFDSMYASTWQSMGKKVIDQMFYKMPLLFWLTKNQRTTMSGSRWIGRQVRLRKNTAAASFGRGGTFSEVDLDTMTVAKYDWKNVGIPLTRYWQDEQENAGKFSMINLVRENTETTVNSLKEEIQGQLWSASPGAQDLSSILTYVPDAPTTGTVAGINSANETAWRNQYKDSNADGSAYTYLLKQMRDLAILSEKWGTIDYIIAGSDAFSIYDDVALEQKQIVNKKMGDAEFTNISWKGIPLVLDYDCPADAMYMLDSRYWEFVTSPTAYFTWTKWKEIPNALDKTAQLVVRGQTVCTKRLPQAVLFDIAA